MHDFSNYKRNRYIEFPDTVILDKSNRVDKAFVFLTKSNKLALQQFVKAGRGHIESIRFVYASDITEPVPEEDRSSIMYIAPDNPNKYDRISENKDMIARYLDTLRANLDVIRTDRAIIELDKIYTATYDVRRKTAFVPETYPVYRVTLNNGKHSYISTSAINTSQQFAANYYIRKISAARSGSLCMASGRMLSKRQYKVSETFTEGVEHSFNEHSKRLLSIWDRTFGSTKPEQESATRADINPIVFPDFVVYNAPGVRNSYHIEKHRICQVGTSNNDVYLSAFDHSGKYLGVIGASERFSKDMEIQNIDSTWVLDPHDPKLSAEFLENASKYAFEQAFECDNIYAGNAIIHLDEHYNIVVGSGRRKVDSHRVSFEDSNKYSFIAASAVNGSIHTACYHIKLAATSPAGSYISSSHAVVPEGEYTVEFDHLKSSQSPLADWVIKTTNLDTKKEEFKKAVEDFKDGKISEVPCLEYIPGTETTLSVVSQLAATTEDIYSYIAPRLDNLQEKLGTVITVLSSNDDKIEKLYNLIDENETTATNSLERVTEIQEALEDLREEFATKFNGMLLDHSSIANKLDDRFEAISNRFDDMSLKFDSLGQSHSTTKYMLNRLEVQVDKVRQDLVEQRSGIVSIVDVMQSTLENVGKEFNKAKDRQLSILSGVSSLMGALQSVVEYQERILQNQERKGFWNWLKSLFKK